MKKIKNQISGELMAKLERAIKESKKRMILTGQGGLSRKELRQLERAKIVKSRPAKLKRAGSWRMAWSMYPSIDLKKVELK